MQPHVSIALNMFMPSTIDSEVGDDEEGGVSMRARRIGLDPNPRARLGTCSRTETRRTGTITAMRTRLAAAVGHHLQQPLSLTRAFR
jgi:hypothetical protein